ncbi:Hint domain-containing protein [Acetobacteraceae bacterium KSS8]|uniref:Hint domain-containing protein n=1 Tax=Endosaccharibacter trunci TaxID=2812733 RepID=A0ABT1W3J2_9PROT|nr:Hint domain-containing protein [Acetobacteraceae bacterium KSS8]
MDDGLVINEFMFNPSLTGDPDEFIEVRGAALTDYSRYSLVVVDGDGNAAGNVDNVFQLGTTDAAGYWVTPFLSNTLQNGTQTVLLVLDYKPGTKDLDTSNSGTFTSTPWSAIVDSIAVYDGDKGDKTYAGAPVLSGATALGASRIPDGSNTGQASDWVANDPSLAGIPPYGDTAASGTVLNTPGAANSAPAAPVPPTVTIQALIGSSYAVNSAYVNTSVTTTGVVTAVDTTGAIGYYIQQTSRDGSTVGSDAIFVFALKGSTLPKVGQTVSVTGKLVNYNGSSTVLATPELNETAHSIVDAGSTAIAPTVIGVGGLMVPHDAYVVTDASAAANLNNSTATLQPSVNALDFYRSLQGQLVTLHNVSVVGATASGATWVVPDGGAGLLDPRGGLIETAGNVNTQRIEIYFDSGVTPGVSPSAVVGDSFGDVTGILSYYNGVFELLPTSALTVTHPSSGVLPQESTGFVKDATHLLVADYNIENFDSLLPANAARLSQLAQIIVHNLNAPDILALQEIQDDSGTTNDGTVTAAQNIAGIIKAIADAGGPTYSYAEIDPTDGTQGGVAGGNIRSIFLYDASRTQLAAPVQAIGTEELNGVFKNTRLPLVGTFTFNGQTVTLVNVHNSSQAGSSELYGATQPPINHGGTTATANNRIAQAQYITNYVNGLQQNDPNAKIGILGDFNDTDGSPAQQVYANGGLQDLNAKEAADSRYTYVFEGNSESLDHTIGTTTFFDAGQFATVHVNAEYPDATRESDHDPSLTLLELTCFLAGTLIRTPDGDVAVDALSVGDLVLTASGEARPLRWIGHRHVDLNRAADPDALRPVRVAAGAIAPGLPERDLLVTPEHCLFLGGGLIPARMLVNGGSIAQVDMRRFTVFHLELDTHDILLAEGLACESYLDTGNRHNFAGGTVTTLHPCFDGDRAEAAMAAPLLVERQVVEPIWRSLAERSQALGFAPAPALAFHTDHELCITLPCDTILPVLHGDAGEIAVSLPEGARTIMLRSRAASPAEMDGPFVDDRRRLGVAVSSIAVGNTMVDLADPALAGAGWHGVESDGALRWRWTDGAATLHLPDTCDGDRLVIRLQGSFRYPAAA